ELWPAVLVQHEIPFGDAPGPVAERADERGADVVQQFVAERRAGAVGAFRQGDGELRIRLMQGRHRARIAAVAVERHAGDIRSRGWIAENRERVRGVPVVVPREDSRAEAGACERGPEVLAD